MRRALHALALAAPGLVGLGALLTAGARAQRSDALAGLVATSFYFYGLLVPALVLAALTRREGAPLPLKWPGALAAGATAALWLVAAAIPPSKGSMMMGPLEVTDLLIVPGMPAVRAAASKGRALQAAPRARLREAAAAGELSRLRRADAEDYARQGREQRSVLFYAARAGQLEALQLMVERGADLSDGDALLGAAEGGDEGCARWLLAQGAGGLRQPQMGGLGDPTPIGAALEAGHRHLVTLFVQEGIEREGAAFANGTLVFAATKLDRPLAELALELGATPQVITARFKETLLHHAISRIWRNRLGDGAPSPAEVEFVRFLLALGLDPDQPARNGRSPREEAERKELEDVLEVMADAAEAP